MGERARIKPEETWALLVAVESYPQSPSLELDGPFPDACDFARWLRDRAVPAEQITLLASPLNNNKSQCDDLRRQGVDCRIDGTVSQEQVEDALDVFRRKAGMLVVFWSGHGIMTPDGVRRPLFDFDKLHRLVKARFSELEAQGQTIQAPIRYHWQTPTGDQEQFDVLAAHEEEASAGAVDWGEANQTDGFIGRVDQIRELEAIIRDGARGLRLSGAGTPARGDVRHDDPPRQVAL